MALEVIDWWPRITLDGQDIATATLTPGTPTAVGPVTVTVDNGSEIGDVRSGSATLTVAEYGSQQPRAFVRGQAATIRVNIAGGETVTLYSGFISESVMTQVKHDRLGLGVETHITLIDVAEFIRDYEIDMSSRFGGDLGIRFPNVNDLVTNVVALLRDRVPKIQHNGINLGSWQDAIVTDMDYVHADGSTSPAADELGGESLANQLLAFIDPNRSYTIRPALELIGTVMAARACIQGDTITTKVSRAFAGDVYTLTDSCITGLSSVASRLSDYWDGVQARIRIEHEDDRSRWLAWNWDIDDDAPGRTQRKYDWHSLVVDSESRGNGRWTSSLVRHLAYAPRASWRAIGLTVLLDQFGKAHGPESITNMLRSIFDVLDGQPALPTLNVPTDSPLMRATGAEVAGVVESAVLTIDPPSQRNGSRARLDVTLGTGDMRPGTNTTNYRGPSWADMTYLWREAPHTPFSDAYIQEPAA